MSYFDKSPIFPLVPLKHVCVLNPETLAENTASDFEFDYIDIGSVTHGLGITSRERMTFEKSPSRARKPVKIDDIIVSTVRTYLRAIAQITAVDDGSVVSTGFAVCRSRNGMDARFLHAVLQAPPFIEQVVASSTGVSYPAINPTTLGNIEVPTPDLPTQKRIAAFLDRETARIDELIAKKERSVDVLNSRFNAMVRDSVTKGYGLHGITLIPSNVVYLREVPNSWSIEKVGWRYSIQLGKMLDAARQTGLSNKPYLRVADVQWDSINSIDLPTMDFSQEDQKKFKIENGDLLVNEGGSYVGRAAIWRGASDEVFYQKSLHRLRPHNPKRDSTEFMLWLMWFATKEGIFVANGNQTTIDHLTAEAFKAYRFAFPSLQEQELIAIKLRNEKERSGKLEGLVIASIDRLREYRAALITAAVTGQIDVDAYAKAGASSATLDRIAEEMQA